MFLTLNEEDGGAGRDCLDGGAGGGGGGDGGGGGGRRGGRGNL
jgi:hypothetical protein